MERITWTSAFALAALVWLGGMAIGFGVVDWARGLPAEMVELPEELLRNADVVEAAKAEHAIAEESSWRVFLFILGRNLSVYLWLLAGLLSAGAITFLVLLFNGVLLGQTVGFGVWQGISAGTMGDLLLPHGVLEVGTFCIAGAVGFQGPRLLREWSQHGWAAVKALRLGLVLAYGAAALAVAAGVEAVLVKDLAQLADAGRGGGN